MSVRLKRYTRQVGPQSQPQASIQGATDMGEFLLGTGVKAAGKGMDQLSEYNAKMDEAEAKTQVAKYKAEQNMRGELFKSEMENITDPKEVESRYKTFVESENEIFNALDANKKARSIIQNNNYDFYSKMGVEYFDAHNKARIGQMDRALVDLEDMAYNGESYTLEDGTVLSPKELFEYANDGRVELGTVDYDDAAKRTRDFSQTVEFRQISRAASQNPDTARQMLDNSTQSPQNTALLEGRIQDGYDKREKETIAAQKSTSDDLNQKMRSRNLTRTNIVNDMEETVDIMGEEVPLIPKSEGDALIAALDAQEEGEIAMTQSHFDGIQESMRDVVKAAQKGKFDKKEFDKVFRGIAVKGKGGKPLYSKGTIETQLNSAQYMLYELADGMNFNSTTTDGLISILDTYATINDNTPYNTRDNVRAMNASIQNYMDYVKENGGNINQEQYETWQKENMTKQMRETAVINARNTYRIGEPVRRIAPGTDAVASPGNVDPTATYRYIGNGEFERMN